MNDSEFKDKFWAETKIKFPSLRIWLQELDKPEKGAAVGMLRQWRSVLADVQIEDALTVLHQMALHEIVPIGSTHHDREGFAATVRTHCKQRAYERQKEEDKARELRLERRNPARTIISKSIGGLKIGWLELFGMDPETRKVAMKQMGFNTHEAAYQCWTCRDSYSVSIWHPRSLERLWREKKIDGLIYTCVAACECEGASRYWSTRNTITRYSPEKHCLYEWGDTKAVNVEGALIWAELYQERRGREFLVEREKDLPRLFHG